MCLVFKHVIKSVPENSNKKNKKTVTDLSVMIVHELLLTITSISMLISVMTLTLLDINQILLSPNPNTIFLDTFFYRDAAYFYFYLVHVFFLSAAQVVMQIYFKVQFNRNITGNYKHRKRLPVKVSVCMLK